MSANSDIEWTDCTWNPVVGCTPVSPGCLNCYAATFSARGMHPNYVGLTVRKGKRSVFNGTVRTLPDKLTDPLHWRKPRRVFVNSMSDLFHEAVPFDFIDRVFAVMALCPQHTFQILTKRPERMAEYMAVRGTDPMEVYRFAMSLLIQNRMKRTLGEETRFPLPNVWLGTSVENQATADERIPHLLKCPAAVRFLSIEPQIEEIGYRDEWADGIHWMIGGGESGPGSRRYDLCWARSGIRFAKRHGISWFQKQLGNRPVEPNGLIIGVRIPLTLTDPKGGDPAEWPIDLRVREMPQVVPS